MMFKKNIECPSHVPWILLKANVLLVFAFVFAGLSSGCRLLAPLPPVDLQQPGWSVKQGQAIWNVKKDGPEIAGEIMLATKGNDHTFVQFTKGPFPMVIGQTTPSGWQIERPAENKRYSGPGKPPTRFILLSLPALLAGAPPPAGWIWQPKPDNGWRLENKQSGESLEGYLE
jgi:hypothetical protein